jgi:hypothetical protein
MMLDPVMASALAIAALGVATAFAGRWRAGLGEWARALIISAFAVGSTGFALTSPSNTLAFWISGFLVCAALHRWIDALNAGKTETAE